MAKKYLLYIHPPQFEKETKKSELVNRLLLNHYEAPGAVSGLEQAIIYESAKKRERVAREDALLSGKTAFISKALARPRIDFSADPKAPLSMHDLPVEVHQKMFKACKHGADPEFCRFRKNGKPCR